MASPKAEMKTEQKEGKPKPGTPEKSSPAKNSPVPEKKDMSPKKDGSGNNKGSTPQSSPVKNDKKENSTDKPASPSKQAETKPSTNDKNSPNKVEKPSSPTSKTPNGNAKSPEKPPEKSDKEKSPKKDASNSSPKKDNKAQQGNGSSTSKEDEPSKNLANGSSDSKEKPAEDNKEAKKETSSDDLKKADNSNKTEEDNKSDSDKKSEGDKNNNESDKKSPKEKKEKKINTKYQLRSEIWNKMFRSSLLVYKQPCNYRIPHFKGDIISAGRLSTMEIFQKAKVVKVSLDKAHECVRLQVIEAGKEMIVGCPGLREAVFLHVKPPMEPSKTSNKLASSRIGIGHVGTALDFSSGVQADLVIVGSVAVDRTGLRVGKGEGFADLEYALLKKLGGIAPDAPIVTIVHDSQVYDTLPETLFQEHDVPADYIVTPTEVIEVNPKRKHPDLMWKILSNRRVNSIPIIKQLLDREKTREGAEIDLKGEDTDTEELEQIAKRKRYFMRRRSYSTSSQRGLIMNMNGPRIRRMSAPSERMYHQYNMMMPYNRQQNNFRNFSSPQQNMYQQRQFWMSRNFQNNRRRLNSYGWKGFKPRYTVECSLKVEGLNNNIRVRDLKAAVTERGIRPRDISWLPHKGMAFLHFGKQKKTEETTEPRDSQSLLNTLKDLIVKAENGPETNLKVEVAQPRKVHFVV